MKAADKELGHSLKIRYGLAPWEPTEVQLGSIKAAIARVTQSGRSPTAEDWHSAVVATCPSAGQHRYSGVDNSDLNTMLALALLAAGGKGQ